MRGLKSRWRCMLGILMVGSLAAAGTVHGQVSGLSVVSLTNGNGQELVKSIRQNPHRMLKSAKLESLADRFIIEELDLVPEQQEQLARLRVEQHRLQRFFKKLADFEFARDPQIMQEVAREVSGAHMAIEQRIEDLLLPHQLDRLRQLEARGEVIVAGLESALTNILRQRWELAPELINEILQEVNSLRVAVAAETAAEWRVMMEGVGSVLTESQQQRWRFLFPDEEGYFVASLSLLTQQASFPGKPEMRYESFLEEFYDTDAGSILTSTGSIKQAQATEVAVTVPRIRLIDICSSKKYGEVVDLHQLLDQLQPDDEDVQRDREFNQRRLGDLQKLVRDEISYEDFVEEMVRDAKRFFLEQFEKIERQVDPEDLYLLELVVRRRLLTQHGLYGCLIAGTLRADLALSDDQVSQFQNLAEQRRAALLKKCRELENKIWDTVRMKLTPAQRSLFDTQLGPHPEAVPGLPDVLLIRG